MINIEAVQAMHKAIAEAKECAAIENRPYAVVVAYNEQDYLCWAPVPVNELCSNDAPVFRTDVVLA